MGAQLLTRSAKGVELTPAGRAFLDHARLALAQVEAAAAAARRASQPAKASFVLGFLTGQEMDWLPDAMRILHDELPAIDVTGPQASIRPIWPTRSCARDWTWPLCGPKRVCPTSNFARW